MSLQIKTLPPADRARYPLDDTEAQEQVDAFSGTAAWSKATGVPLYRMTHRAFLAALWNHPAHRRSVPLGPFRAALWNAHHEHRAARAFTVRIDGRPLLCERAGTDKAPIILIDTPEGC